MSMTDDIADLNNRARELERADQRLKADLDERFRTIQEQIKAVYERIREIADAPPGKPWWASKGVMGGLVATLGTLGQVAGYVFGWPPEALAALAALSGGGGLTAVRGRITATQPIK